MACLRRHTPSAFTPLPSPFGGSFKILVMMTTIDVFKEHFSVTTVNLTILLASYLEEKGSVG